MRCENRTFFADCFHALTRLATAVLAFTLLLPACDTRHSQNAAEHARSERQPGITEQEESDPSETVESQPGTETPTFDWNELDGTPIVRAGGDLEEASSSEFDDRPTLFVYWGIWCHTCHEELADLTDWHSHPRAQNLHIVTVNNDGQTHHDRAKEEASKPEWPFDTLLPTTEQLAQWNPRALTPTTVLYAPDGSELARVIGFGSNERAELFKLLSQFE